MLLNREKCEGMIHYRYYRITQLKTMIWQISILQINVPLECIGGSFSNLSILIHLLLIRFMTK